MTSRSIPTLAATVLIAVLRLATPGEALGQHPRFPFRIPPVRAAPIVPAPHVRAFPGVDSGRWFADQNRQLDQRYHRQRSALIDARTQARRDLNQELSRHRRQWSDARQHAIRYAVPTERAGVVRDYADFKRDLERAFTDRRRAMERYYRDRLDALHQDYLQQKEHLRRVRRSYR